MYPREHSRNKKRGSARQDVCLPFSCFCGSARRKIISLLLSGVWFFFCILFYSAAPTPLSDACCKFIVSSLHVLYLPARSHHTLRSPSPYHSYPRLREQVLTSFPTTTRSPLASHFRRRRLLSPAARGLAAPRSVQYPTVVQPVQRCYRACRFVVKIQSQTTHRSHLRSSRDRSWSQDGCTSRRIRGFACLFAYSSVDSLDVCPPR